MTRYAYKEAIDRWAIQNAPCEFLERTLWEKMEEKLLVQVHQAMGSQPYTIRTERMTMPAYDDFDRKVNCMVTADVEPVREVVVRREYALDRWMDLAAPVVRQCLWCSSLSEDDKYHSGTCENCGGPRC